MWCACTCCNDPESLCKQFVYTLVYARLKYNLTQCFNQADITTVKAVRFLMNRKRSVRRKLSGSLKCPQALPGALQLSTGRLIPLPPRTYVARVMRRRLPPSVECWTRKCLLLQRSPRHRCASRDRGRGGGACSRVTKCGDSWKRP